VQTVVDQYRREVAVNVEDAWGHVETVTVDQPQEARPHVTYNSGNNEWYTPAEYIDAAYEVMGEIHLDPASSARANEIVEANEYFDAERNGLEQPWGGCVWMNPPYAAELIGKFCAKFAHHVRSGEIEQGIVLVNNATETEWFSTLVGVCTAVVFPRGRVRFWQPSGVLGAPLQGQAVLYAGSNGEKFLEVFRGFGWGTQL
jgi:phage N-6-adenine-methyltransferase